MTDLHLHDPELERLLSPTDDAIERMHAPLRAQLDSAPTTPALPSARSRPARRRVRLASVGIAIAGAAVLSVVAALSPGSDPGRTGDGPAARPDSPRAALLAAADAAGRAEWRPLGEDEYHHVYFTTFTPEFENVFEHRSFDFFNPQHLATESFMNSEGRGVRLDITGGGGDPDEYPKLLPTTGGQGLAYSGTDGGLEPVEDVEASLHYPDTVRTWSWPLDRETPTQTVWVRQPEGFVNGQSGADRGLPYPGLDTIERSQVSHWGDTLEQLTALDELEGDALDRAVLELLDSNPRDGLGESSFVPAGYFGATAGQLADQARVQRAVKLLGSAPLAPHARQAIFEYLADRDDATFDHDATDALGRRGTRVTFETIHDEEVPAGTIALEELRRRMAGPDGTLPRVTDAKAEYPVPAHRQQRRWYVSIVFDTETGELLEQVQYDGYRTSKPLPSLQPDIDGSDWRSRGPYPWIVKPQVLYSLMTDSALYLTRERATKIEPDAAVCADHPEVCR